MSSKTYQLKVTREGRWWIIDAPEIDYRTQARTLADVDAMGRDLIAGALDVDAESFDIALQIAKPADVEAQLAEVTELERKAQEVVSRAARGRREAARTLREQYGLSVVDTARMLGVTRGRVYQLLDSERDTVA